jgi:hypothetical protein
MTAQELIKKQMDETESMLAQTFKGLSDETAATKIGSMMSPKEMVAHLAECYVAAKKDIEGTKHEWGTYSPPSQSWDNLLDELGQRRKEAVDAILLKGDDQALRVATDFIVGHDHYHIGQLCAIRISIDPAWDSYSIYEQG